MGYSITVMNGIRAEGSDEYQNRIPEATRANLINIGMSFQQYKPLFNEFVSAFFNKIGKTTIEQKMFENRLKRFKGEMILSGKDIEEIFVNPAMAEGNYDPNGTNPLGRRPAPDVKVAYHRKNREYYFAKSLGDIDFLRVFQSEATLDNWMTAIINSMYAGDELDEWYSMKNVLATYGCKFPEGVENPDEAAPEEEPSGYFNVEVPEIKGDSPETACKQFLKTVRKLSADISYPSDEYNMSGVMTQTKKQNQILFVHKDVLAECDVEVLAKVFNMGKTDIETQIFELDNFGMLDEHYNNFVDGNGQITYALLVDDDFFRVHDTLIHMEPQRNAQGLFTNWFYHHHQILSASPFKNAVRFYATKA